MSVPAYPGTPGPYGVYGMDDPTDVVGSRIVAKIIDGLVGLPILVLVIWWMFHNAETFPVSDPAAYCANFDQVNQICLAGNSQVRILRISGWILYGPSLLLWLAYVTTEATLGWTPGKLVMGLRVIRADNGLTIGFGKSIIRAVVWIVDGFCVGIVAFFTASRSPGHQRLGDQAASTLVVRKYAAGQRPIVPGLTVGPTNYYQPGTGQTPPWTPGYPPAGPPAQPTSMSHFNADEPIWDEQRSAYIQFDTQQGAWLQYDDASAAWKPIST